MLYGDGGLAYVFLAYGMHACLNATAGRRGEPGCVLIRSLEPLAGLRAMARRRGVPTGSRRLASGPGNLARALAIALGDNGADLTHGDLTIRAPRRRPPCRIAVGPRIGITRATEWPLRFWIGGSPFVSR